MDAVLRLLGASARARRLRWAAPAASAGQGRQGWRRRGPPGARPAPSDAPSPSSSSCCCCSAQAQHLSQLRGCAPALCFFVDSWVLLDQRQSCMPAQPASQSHTPQHSTRGER
jgi:hypothetical protein|eukprot:COSAG01_NODE_5188_length_4423_cov_6.890148_4_plen_113_part_00